MRRPPVVSATHPAGFGLVELMVALVLMASLMVVIHSALSNSQHQAQRLSHVAEERQMARSAVQLIERETRMAGSGWGRDTVMAARGGAPWSLWAVNPGYGGSGQADSLVLVGAWGAMTTLTAPMATVNASMQVADITGFNAGDFVVLTNGVATHMLQVTGTQATPPTLLHANTSSYNSGQVQWPLGGGYPSGTTSVYKVTMVTYRYDSTTYHRPALVRQEYLQAPQVVAYNVDGFRVWYDMQDGTLTRNPNNLNFVDQIIPVVLTRVTDPRRATLRDSVWASIRPRTF
jgi:prepilin-type N-terminal cleavage/methylation domain-containing protein